MTNLTCRRNVIVSMDIIKNIKSILGYQTDSAQQIQESESSQTLPRKTVLIVEDEPSLANALELKLTKEGFNVLKAANGQIGLDLAISNKPDIILLDLVMPVMDGKTMLHKLRDIPDFKNLPVIVLTNAGDTDNIRETKVYDNASAFLIKSNVSTNEIVEAINDLI